MGSDIREKPARAGRLQKASRDPERTQAAILKAATAEFAEKGIGGARVDMIAERAGTNKRMLYHYFGDKAGLYVAVLEAAYGAIRSAERGLDLAHKAPEEALCELTRFTWHYFLEHPEFISLLNTENLHKARHMKGSRKLMEMHSHFVTELAEVLKRGAEAGVFRAGIDPINVYITIAALGYFYLSNRHTLSAIFDRDLADPARLADWEAHVVRTVLAAVRP
ncbi:TetR/AcrR family transcriptional regulator [Chelativorans intermedius]|uniref:TetR/AcrR family transcriptional regulator n=1 Tax=Chelativorans intermedius TaxID=515947 RepID=A0ABV6D6E6_9HYPH|nr:TetR/AcrR family transcriptional regulator [Chelativorans intermedius]MCT8999461.1 TetR family transcriptional regulator [Chelativorans intermedius]